MYLEVALLTVCLYDAVSSIHSNAIKTGDIHSAGHPATAATQVSAAKNNSSQPIQVVVCRGDRDCLVGQFCPIGRSATTHCINCRKSRKRCARDTMCCPGARCNNGLCTATDATQVHGSVQEIVKETWDTNGKHPTVEIHPRKATIPSRSLSTKGEDGDICLRSSDCAIGLCCARHFWTKICKPVLQEGQVCTKSKRKGSHGLEIFQRCDCSEGFTCRMQKAGAARGGKTSRLHTCQ